MITKMKLSIALQLVTSLAVIARETPRCCSSLDRKNPGKVTLPTHVEYATTLNGFWSSQERDIEPGCVFHPTLADELAAVIHLAHQGCKFAIKGGGHTPFAGAANIEGGILVDMSGFDEVTVDERGSIARIGAGQKWGHVYRKLDALGLAISGGRVASVGVAGLTLGGGLSYFSPRYGFVCDNVVNYEIVLANGTLTSVNANHHPLLFRALKGGSNNFGIVTSFSFRTFPQPHFSLWGGNVLYVPTPAGFTPHFAAFESFATVESFATEREQDPYAAVIMNIAYSDQAKSWFVMHNLAYTKREADPAALKGFTEVDGRIQNTLRFTNLTDLAMEFEAGVAVPGMRQVFATLQTIPSAALLSRINTISQACLQPLLSVPSISWALSFQPISTTMVSNRDYDYDFGNGRGVFIDDYGSTVNILLTVSYSDRDDDSVVEAQIKKFLRKAKKEARKVLGLKRFVYLNYAAHWQNPLKGLRPFHLGMLQRVSKEYDPSGIFQHNVPGGFKLFPPNKKNTAFDQRLGSQSEATSKKKGAVHGKGKEREEELPPIMMEIELRMKNLSHVMTVRQGKDDWRLDQEL